MTQQNAPSNQEEVARYLSLSGYDVKEVHRFENTVQIQTPNFSMTPQDISMLSGTPGVSELFPNGASIQTPGFLFSTPQDGTPFLTVPGVDFGMDTPNLSTPNLPFNTSVQLPQQVPQRTIPLPPQPAPQPTQSNKRKVPPPGLPQTAAKRKKPSSLKLPTKNNTIKAKKVAPQNVAATTTTTTAAPPQQPAAATAPTITNVNDDNQTEIDENDPSRAWIITEKHTPHDLQVSVSSKTRCDPETKVVPRQMFSSLKYQIKVTIRCDAALRNEFSCLIARCTVVDAEDGYREILKDGNVILDDTPEVALSLTKDGYTGTLKVRFTDCSYHHNSHDFSWVLKFFAPKNLTTPLLVVRSGPYRVLARRPKSTTKSKKSSTKKTKKSAKESTTNGNGVAAQPAAPAPQTSAEPNPFEIFESKLEELVQSTKYFKEDEKKTALELVSKKLLEADPRSFVRKIAEADARNNKKPDKA